MIDRGEQGERVSWTPSHVWPWRHRDSHLRSLNDRSNTFMLHFKLIQVQYLYTINIWGYSITTEYQIEIYNKHIQNIA